MGSTAACASTSESRRPVVARLTAGLALALAISGLAPPALAEASSETSADAVVLMYHHVGEDGQPSTRVTEDQFEAHLERIEAEGHEVVPLAAVVDALTTGADLPDKAVAITFDDGYRSVGEVAHSYLAERGWPYTVFVNTDPVDAGFDQHLDWARMRGMAAEGATFANHSASHAPLFERREGEDRAAWAERISDDLTRAQRRLEDELGEAVTTDPPLLAYPYGEYDRALMDLVDELGYVAFGQQSGAIGATSRLQALPRFSLNERYGEPEPFALRLGTRALPVAEQSPVSPVRESDAAPRLTVTLAADDLATDRLGCFYGGERLDVEWQTPGRRFSVQGEADLPVGRSRYNCTLPDGEGGYYWFSQLWVYGEAGT